VPASLAKKLQLRPGQYLALLNAPAGFAEGLAAELASIGLSTQTTSPSAAVLLFVNDLAEAKRLAVGVIAAVKPDDLIWIAYPKGSSKVKTDIHRDRLRELLESTGWRAVRLIALDEIWSAMRFRPAEK
jgi:hypothetical protein